jgi:TrmH family RNA methyltransferase
LERQVSYGAHSIVTSLSNPKVKAARALHLRKEREESGLFLAEGLKIVLEAIDMGHAPRMLFYGKDADVQEPLQRAIKATIDARGETIEVNRDILEKVSRRDNPQAVVGVFEQRFTPINKIDPKSAGCFVALEQVRDPGNLGTIIRTADAAGCGGVILIGDTVDPFSVEAVRATMGSVFALPIAKVTREEFLAWRKRWPGSVVGTLLTAKSDHRSTNYRAPTLILMGAEQSGLTPEIAAACDVNVKIPMRGRADSLNLAVATGIMIYAVTESV